MPGFTIPQVLDLVNETTQIYLRDHFVEASLPRQKYPCALRFLRAGEGMEKMPVSGGDSLQFEVKVRDAGTYHESNISDTINPVQVDHMKSGVVPWFCNRSTYSFSAEAVRLQGSGPERIVRYLAPKIQSAYNDMYEGFEITAKRAPTAATTDPAQFYGIDSWVVQQTGTDGTFGFRGLNPSTLSAGPGGISASEFPQTANGSGHFDSLGHNDGLAMLTTAMEKCHFAVPFVAVPEVDEEPLPQYELWTTYASYHQIGLTQVAANDNTGHDSGRFYRPVNWRGVPVEWVPSWGDSTSEVYQPYNDIIGFNWYWWEFFYHQDMFMQFSDPVPVPGRVETFTKILTNWMGLACRNRRAQFRLHSTTWTPTVT